jgi:long-chain fatty acid transport protein
VSYKLDDHHAFGFGVSAQYMKAYLSKAVDLTGVPNTGDGHAALSADGWGFGFNLGYMYQLNDATVLVWPIVPISARSLMDRRIGI